MITAPGVPISCGVGNHDLDKDRGLCRKCLYYSESIVLEARHVATLERPNPPQTIEEARAFAPDAAAYEGRVVLERPEGLMSDAALELLSSPACAPGSIFGLDREGEPRRFLADYAAPEPWGDELDLDALARALFDTDPAVDAFVLDVADARVPPGAKDDDAATRIYRAREIAWSRDALGARTTWTKRAREVLAKLK